MDRAAALAILDRARREIAAMPAPVDPAELASRLEILSWDVDEAAIDLDAKAAHAEYYRQVQERDAENDPRYKQ